MKYYIKGKLTSLHKRFYVYDESGNRVYEISSKVLSFGNKTTLYEMNGQKHAYIEQRVLHLLSHYDIYIEDQMICSIARKFKLTKKSYELTNGYSVDGNILGLNFNVIDPSGNKMASIKRKAFSITEKYEIEIIDEKQELLALSILIVIANDVIQDKQNDW